MIVILLPGGLLNNRTIIFVSFILAIIIFIFHLYAKKELSGEETGMLFDAFKKPAEWQGRIAPDFEVGFLNGETFKLSENIGKKVIILNFFATWCSPCKTEMPELNAFYEKHKDEPFIFIGINADEKTEKVNNFIAENSIRFPVGIDKDNKLQKLFAVTGFPTTIFIGADGAVHIYEIGPITNSDIAFNSVYKVSFDIVKSGNGISKDDYIRKLREQEQSKPLTTEDKKEDGALTGRAKEIAEKMNCPCGCDDILVVCTCKTAKDIKSRLRNEALSSKTDEEIIRELNKEFCVRGKKSGHDQG